MKWKQEVEVETSEYICLVKKVDGVVTEKKLEKELVRCKDCKWHKPKYIGERPTCLIYVGDWHDDDYCSRVERKTE